MKMVVFCYVYDILVISGLTTFALANWFMLVDADKVGLWSSPCDRGALPSSEESG